MECCRQVSRLMNIHVCVLYVYYYIFVLGVLGYVWQRRSIAVGFEESGNG